jgi:hypothetical protein
MIRAGRYKLIYYPVGNYRQLFDLEADPQELIDLSASADHADTLTQLTDLLIGQLYGGDEAWVQNGRLVGLPDHEFQPGPNKGLSSQRGVHWPPPPKTDMPQIEWVPEEKK